MTTAKTKPAPKPDLSIFGGKTAEDVALFGKSNVEAFVQAGSAFFHGIEELTRSFVGLTQAQLDANVAAAKALLGVKSIEELGELQKIYTRTAFDNAVSEASRLSEIAIRISNETIEPLTARVQATIEQLSKPPLAA
jgi:phasin family protein